jgi:hypothetical protein
VTRHIVAALLVIVFFAGYMLRCEGVDLVLIRPCDGGGFYELAFLDVDPPEVAWSGNLDVQRCVFVAHARSRQIAARCDGSEWVSAIYESFDADLECGGG